MKENITAPILVIGFNRPHCIKKIIEQLSTFEPTNLYFSIDGARPHKDGEYELVEEVIALTKTVTWECNVHYNYHKKNVGAEINVSSAISWVLETEPYVIVNEDDIYAPYAFYKFVQEMLIKYMDDERIGMVSGDNFTPMKMETDYTFGKYGHTWGWGTWNRVWKDFNLYEELSDDVLDFEYLKPQCASEEIASRVLRNLQTQKLKGKGNITWDHMFSYLRYKKGYLSIIPQYQLTSNIGIVGLHYSGYTLEQFTKVKEDFIANTHPQEVTHNREYDIHHFYHYVNPSFIRKVYRKLKTLYLAKFVYNKKYQQEFFGFE